LSTFVAFTDAIIFAVGAVIAIAVFTAALGFAYVRFAELGEEDARRG